MRTFAVLALMLALSAAFVGCDEPVQVGQGLGGAGTPGGAPPPPGAAEPPAPAEEPDAGTLLSYLDDDFVESESNRDPFRNYAVMFKVRALESPQRAVIMPTTAIEQMRLMAIISNVAQPRAMLVDPAGVGYSVKRGDFIGRPEVVQTGGSESTPLTLNWRVDRIRGCTRGSVNCSPEIVLTREDPTAPGRVPLSRVVPLYDEDDVAQGTAF